MALSRSDCATVQLTAIGMVRASLGNDADGGAMRALCPRDPAAVLAVTGALAALAATFAEAIAEVSGEEPGALLDRLTAGVVEVHQ